MSYVVEFVAGFIATLMAVSAIIWLYYRVTKKH